MPIIGLIIESLSKLTIIEVIGIIVFICRKIDTWRTTNGVAFNCKFPTTAVSTDRDLNKWADLVRTYVLLGGQTVQYTIVDNNALKEAQIHPEDYKDLIVRTGGYSALFIELDKETQDTIIGRTEHQI